MLAVVHAAIEYFIKESPLEVKAEAGSRCGCSDKSRLITHTIIKNHRVGVCWFWRGLSALIAHNCTGCHPRRTCSGAISALWGSFDSESGGKKRFALIIKQVQLMPTLSCSGVKRQWWWRLRHLFFYALPTPQQQLWTSPPALGRSRAAAVYERFVVSVPVRPSICPTVHTFSLFFATPPSKSLNKHCVSWCLTVCTAHAPLMSNHTGLPVDPASLTYLLFGSLHPPFMLKLTLGAEAGRQGASLPRASRDVAQLSAV